MQPEVHFLACSSTRLGSKRLLWLLPEIKSKLKAGRLAIIKDEQKHMPGALEGIPNEDSKDHSRLPGSQNLWAIMAVQPSPSAPCSALLHWLPHPWHTLCSATPVPVVPVM